MAKTNGVKNSPKCKPTQLVLPFPTGNTLQTLMGEHDGNVHLIEKRLDVQIKRHEKGLSIAVLDADVELAADLLRQLSEIIQRGEQIFSGDIERSIKMLSDNRNLKLSDIFRDHIKVGGRKHMIAPKTVCQKHYIDAIRSSDVVFGIGPAGTGKTYLAMAMGLAALLRKDVKKLILCRPAVEAGEKLGFLPGDMADKVNPYLRPLYDALYDMVDFEKAEELLECKAIEVAPLAFMRGRTLSSAFVILDEGQNATKGQMKMFLTRLGFGSKCVVTGDITQIDLPNGVQSGLIHAENILAGVEGISMIYFSDQDVIRHPLVARIINAYQKFDN